MKPNYTLSNEELHQFLENKIAPYKKLRGGIIQIDSIPKTASGKILRRVLKTKLNEKKD